MKFFISISLRFSQVPVSIRTPPDTPCIGTRTTSVSSVRRLITAAKRVVTWRPASTPTSTRRNSSAAPAPTSHGPKCAPNTGRTFSSTNADIAAPSPSSSASAPLISATHATMIFRLGLRGLESRHCHIISMCWFGDGQRTHPTPHLTIPHHTTLHPTTPTAYTSLENPAFIPSAENHQHSQSGVAPMSRRTAFHTTGRRRMSSARPTSAHRRRVCPRLRRLSERPHFLEEEIDSFVRMGSNLKD